MADIFAGSGTTNLEAMRLGRHSYALDVNPVASLITTAKTAIVQPEVLAKTILEIITSVTTDATGLTLQSALVQELLVGKDQNALLHWFPEHNIVELALILDLINRIECYDLKALLLLIFSSSLKLASNWLDWSVKPQRDRRPQTPENPNEIDPDVRYQRVVPPSLEVFSSRGKEVLKRYTAAAPILRQQAAYRPQIVCADVIEHPLGEDQFDTIITSPPYLTSYEYADLHRLTVLWLHHNQTIEEFKRSGFIGTKLQQTTPLPDSLVNNHSLNNLRDQMKPSPLRQVDQYFTSMHNCFTKARQALRPGGYLCIVIGDSRYKGYDISNHAIYLDMLDSMGFNIEDVWERPIPNKRLTSLRDATTGRILPNVLRGTSNAMEIYPTEHILILKK